MTIEWSENNGLIKCAVGVGKLYYFRFLDILNIKMNFSDISIKDKQKTSIPCMTSQGSVTRS